MSHISISDIQSDKGSLQFTLSGDHEYGLDKSVANALRRTLLNDIPTVAFETDEGLPPDLTMVTNHSVLHNEMLLHRVALVPLYLDPEGFHKHYFFECHVVHDSPDPFKFITANDMNIYPLRQHLYDRIQQSNDESVESDPHEVEALRTVLQTHSPDNYDLLQPLTQKEKDNILRPFKFRGNQHYCLLNELKHTGTEGIHQEVHFFGSPSVNTGRSNSRYQAVSQASYSFLHDENLIQKTLEDKLTLKQISEEEKPRFTRKFMLGEAGRYFKRDRENEPNHYLFKIKSTHFWPSGVLFQKACEILMDGCEHLKASLLSILQDTPKSVTLQQQNDTTYTLTMNHQSHTLGNAIQCHVSRRSVVRDGLLLTCGYKQPHPLEDSIVLYLSLNPTHKVMKETEIHKTQALLTFMMDQLDELKDIFKSILEISQTNL
jgi:DNA-directed RNA polymerase subunit L